MRAPSWRRSLLAALALSALLVLYGFAVGRTGVALIATGELIAVALGLAVVVLPLLAVALLVREWVLAVQVQAMADELAASGRLPVDELPRTPGGRIVRDATDAAFADVRRAVEEDPDDWSRWFAQGFSYDAARDRRRARAALRRAAQLRRAVQS